MAATPAHAATFSWASGNFVPGTTAPGTLATGDVLNIVAGTGKTFDAVSFINNGTVNWAAGTVGSPNSLLVRNNASVTNNGLWLATTTGTNAGGNLLPAFGSGGPGNSFTNTGTLQKDGEGRLTIRVASFVNSGQLVATAGVLNIDGLGQASTVFSAGSSFIGAGLIEVGSQAAVSSAENYQFNGTFSSTNLSLNTVNGSGTATYTGNAAVLTGSMAWRAGRLAGSWTVAPDAVMNVGGSVGSNRTLTGTLNVLGTLSVDASGFNANGTLTNNGSIEVKGGTTNGGTIINNGTLRQTTGFAGSAFGGTNFINNGRIENNGGLLILRAGTNPTGATFNPGTVFAGSGAIELDLGFGGTSTFNGAFTSANTSLVGRQSNLVGNNAVQSGLVKWVPMPTQSLTVSGTWRVATDGELALTGGASTSIRALSGAATVLTVDGKLAVDAPANLSIGNGARLVNNGTVELKVDQGFVDLGATLPGSFINNGALVKTGGTGTSTLGGATALTVINNGTIDVRTGTIRLRDNFSNAGTLKGDGTLQVVGTLTNNGVLAPGAMGTGSLDLVAGGLLQAASATLQVDLTSLADFDLLNITGNASLGGTLALNCLGACSFALGDSFTILDASGSLGGSFANVVLSNFGTGAFAVEYDLPTASVRLRVTQAVSPVPEPATWLLLLAGVAGLAMRRQARG